MWSWDNDMDGGGDNFLRRFTAPNDDDGGGEEEEEIKATFSLTGNNCTTLNRNQPWGDLLRYKRDCGVVGCH